MEKPRTIKIKYILLFFFSVQSPIVIEDDQIDQVDINDLEKKKQELLKQLQQSELDASSKKKHKKDKRDRKVGIALCFILV